MKHLVGEILRGEDAAQDDGCSVLQRDGDRTGFGKSVWSGHPEVQGIIERPGPEKRPEGAERGASRRRTPGSMWHEKGV